MPVAMAADAPMGPMDAARSMEVENWDAPAEHWPADPVGHPTHMSDTNYRARADVQFESTKKAPSWASTCWWMRLERGERRRQACSVTVLRRRDRRALSLHDLRSKLSGGVRILQQVEGLLCRPVGAFDARDGANA